MSEFRPADEEIDESADDVAKHFVASHDNAQSVCAAPSAGPAHPAAVKAKKSKFGDCTKDEWLSLRKPVVDYCKASGALERCEPSDSCDTLRRKAGRFLQCRDARVQLRDRCYRNAQDTHNVEIQTVEKGMNNCNEYARSKGC